MALQTSGACKRATGGARSQCSARCLYPFACQINCKDECSDDHNGLLESSWKVYIGVHVQKSASATMPAKDPVELITHAAD